MSEMQAELQHIETETADQTIERFDGIILWCKIQGADTPDDLQKRMIIAHPNDRYTILKKSYQHAAIKMDMETLQKAMQDDDIES